MGPTKKQPGPTTGPAGLWFGSGGHGSRTPRINFQFLKLWNPKLWLSFLIVWCVSGFAATAGAAEQLVDPLKLAALAVVGVGVGALCDCAPRDRQCESQHPPVTRPTQSALQSAALSAALSDSPANPDAPVLTPNLRQSSQGKLAPQYIQHTTGADNTDGAVGAEQTQAGLHKVKIELTLTVLSHCADCVDCALSQAAAQAAAASAAQAAPTGNSTKYMLCLI
jgi:hypothetical protein